MLKLIDDLCPQQPAASEAELQYDDVVYRLAIGDDPTFEQVCLVLAAAGKTAADLANDVKARQTNHS
jgi:hypothetical protein